MQNKEQRWPKKSRDYGAHPFRNNQKEATDKLGGGGGIASSSSSEESNRENRVVRG